MLIRSQDKNSLISMDNISYLEMEYGYPADDRCIIWATFDGANQVDVGIYSSIDKAEAVLDDIQLTYNFIKQTEIAGSMIGADAFTYQMPADDDPWFDKNGQEDG